MFSVAVGKLDAEICKEKTDFLSIANILKSAALLNEYSDVLADIGEVDIEYPESLHDAHNDYPLAPEHLKVTNNMLSPYQQENFPPSGSVKKLIPNIWTLRKQVKTVDAVVFVIKELQS